MLIRALLILAFALSPLRAEGMISCMMRLLKGEAPFVLTNEHVKLSESFRIYDSDLRALLLYPETAVRTRILIESIYYLRHAPPGFYEDVAYALRSPTYSTKVAWIYKLDPRRWFHGGSRFAFKYRLAKDVIRRHKLPVSRDTIGSLASFLEIYPDANWKPTREERLTHIIALATPYHRKIWVEFKREFLEKITPILIDASEHQPQIFAGKPAPPPEQVRRALKETTDHARIALLELLGTEFKRDTPLWNRVDLEELTPRLDLWLQVKGFGPRLRALLLDFLVEYLDPWNPTGPHVEADTIAEDFERELRREATRLVRIAIQLREAQKVARAATVIVPRNDPTAIPLGEPAALEDEPEPENDAPETIVVRTTPTPTDIIPRRRAPPTVFHPPAFPIEPVPELELPPLSAAAKKALGKREWDVVLNTHNNVGFHDAYRIATAIFGEPRSSGSSHVVYTPPWPGHPVLLTRHRGGKLPMYQAKELKKALNRMYEMYATQLAAE